MAIMVGYGRILEVVLMQTELTRLGCMDLGYILQNVKKMRLRMSGTPTGLEHGENSEKS